MFSTATDVTMDPSREAHFCAIGDFFARAFIRSIFVRYSRQRDAGPKIRTSLCEARFLFIYILDSVLSFSSIVRGCTPK